MLRNSNSIETTFSALADSTRMAIIERLTQGETSLSELAAPFRMSQTAVTKHVTVLSNAGLVKIRKRGRTRYCELSPNPLQEAENWLVTYQKFWSDRFENLADFIEQDRKK